MTVSNHKRVTIVLVLACLGLLVLCGSLFWSHGVLKLRVALASQQTKIFEDMRSRVLQSDARGAVECLEYVVRYYPSGTKQETGSRLDRMVERERAAATRDIIAHLRAKTGEELGAAPEAWIEKYGASRNAKE
jgi:hypothetical protein